MSTPLPWSLPTALVLAAFLSLLGACASAPAGGSADDGDARSRPTVDDAGSADAILGAFERPEDEAGDGPEEGTSAPEPVDQEGPPATPRPLLQDREETEDPILDSLEEQEKAAGSRRVEEAGEPNDTTVREDPILDVLEETGGESGERPGRDKKKKKKKKKGEADGEGEATAEGDEGEEEESGETEEASETEGDEGEEDEDEDEEKGEGGRGRAPPLA